MRASTMRWIWPPLTWEARRSNALQQLRLNAIGLNMGANYFIHILLAGQIVEQKGLPQTVQHCHPRI